MASFTASFAPALPRSIARTAGKSQKPSTRGAVRVCAKGDGTRVDKFSKSDVMYDQTSDLVSNQDSNVVALHVLVVEKSKWTLEEGMSLLRGITLGYTQRFRSLVIVMAWLCVFGMRSFDICLATLPADS
jgi:hypothetical protein